MSYESHKYYNGNLYVGISKNVKSQRIFMDLHAGIAMDVKKPTIIMRPICKYCNGCKKTNNYYKTYMQILQWL
jgi:hypothetical protein